MSTFCPEKRGALTVTHIAFSVLALATGLRVAWGNRDGRSRRPDMPAPDFEVHDLTALLPLLART